MKTKLNTETGKPDEVIGSHLYIHKKIYMKKIYMEKGFVPHVCTCRQICHENTAKTIPVFRIIKKPRHDAVSMGCDDGSSVRWVYDCTCARVRGGCMIAAVRECGVGV